MWRMVGTIKSHPKGMEKGGGGGNSICLPALQTNFELEMQKHDFCIFGDHSFLDMGMSLEWCV